MTDIIRHKGRDYTVKHYEIGWEDKVYHTLTIVISPKGRNVRVQLDGKLLKP